MGQNTTMFQNPEGKVSTDKQTNRQTDGQTNGWTDKQMDGKTDKRTNGRRTHLCLLLNPKVLLGKYIRLGSSLVLRELKEIPL